MRKAIPIQNGFFSELYIDWWNKGVRGTYSNHITFPWRAIYIQDPGYGLENIMNSVVNNQGFGFWRIINLDRIWGTNGSQQLATTPHDALRKASLHAGYRRWTWARDISMGRERGTWAQDKSAGHVRGTWARDMSAGHKCGTWARDMSAGHYRGTLA